MKTKFKLSIIFILLITLVITGCTKQETVVQETEGHKEVEGELFPREYTDGFGNTIAIKEEITRIISVVPSHTEILFALGLEDKVVAVSDYCDYPVEALDKEKIGGYQTLNIERIIELDPDILFIYGGGDDEAIQQLEAVGITIAKYEPESIQEILDTIASIAVITNTEEKGQELIKAMEEKRDSIIEKVKDQENVRVFYEIWHEPLMSAGEGSFINELITLVGGENVAKEAEGAYPIFSVEALVENDPEVYLKPSEYGGKIAAMTEEKKNMVIDEIKNRPGFTQITAVKNDNIHLLDPNIISRPGIRIVEALELVAEAIHPEVF
ncbi:MAG: cobalamin-binding protein [Clostridiaceae bacterium]|nr:cobalamin-binding protein [Clostridiaceae bacterium]